MVGKLLPCQRIKRAAFSSDQEYLAALRAAGRDAEAEAYAIRKGLLHELGSNRAHG